MAGKELVKKDPRDIELAGAMLTATGIQFGKDLTFDQWQGIGEFLERAEGAVQWWIGDWLNHGEGRPQWGDKYEQAISLLNRPYHTLEKYKAVARTVEFRNRLRNLSWTHHLALAYESPETRRELLAAAEPEAPDRPARLSVAELKKEVRLRRRGENTPPLPPGQYRVLYADPPWKYADGRTADEFAGDGQGAATGAAVAVYDPLDTDVLCALCHKGRAIQDVPAKDSVLFLWVTAPVLPDGLRVMAAWGFSYKAQFVWDKVRGFNGHYNDVRHELLLVGVKGQCQPAEGQLADSVVVVEKEAHSAKPAEFYDTIESLYPDGPYLELFARRPRDGWDKWGHEA